MVQTGIATMMLERLATAVIAASASMMAVAALSGAAALTLPAAPVPPLASTADAPVELVHGCHRGIQRDYSGWHFHSRACVRNPVSPPGLADGPTYRRYYRGPLCSYRCRYVGPVKTCQQVCR